VQKPCDEPLNEFIWVGIGQKGSFAKRHKRDGISVLTNAAWNLSVRMKDNLVEQLEMTFKGECLQ